jgi:hypothetical protein
MGLKVILSKKLMLSFGIALSAGWRIARSLLVDHPEQ